MREVLISGVGQTAFGEDDRSLRELGAAAAIAALDDANVGTGAIEAAFVGNVGEGIAGQMCLRELGITGISVVNVENACSSSSCAFQQAYRAVAAGWHDIVLVLGVEKMTDGSALESLRKSGDTTLESDRGMSFPSVYGMYATAYAEQYDVDATLFREALARISVKNHANAIENPYAQFHRELTVEEVCESPQVATPLRLLDMCPISDGAAAAVVAAPEAIESTVPAIRIEASVHHSGQYESEPLATATGEADAAAEAYEAADISPADVDVFEVHDAATISELQSYEALGICEAGSGTQFTLAGGADRDGSSPVNPSGGLKARGHPIGATGVAQLAELVWQLRGEAGARQIPDAMVGLAENSGGALNGVSANTTIHVLRRVD